jgi:hypothetical protein
MTLATVMQSQNSTSEYLDYQKYWYYRDRLKYFVVPGQNDGESMIAGIRNRLEGGNIRSLSYGQHGVYYGYYLGVLATEYYLLSSSEQDYSETLMELSFALNAYIEQMDKCEEKFYHSPDNYDGFFIRDNITCDLNFVQDHIVELNKNLADTNTWDKFKDGRPGYINMVQGCPDNSGQNGRQADPMSQDEAIGLLKGLSLVYRCLPENSNEKNLAKEIALKITTKMWGLGTWIIMDPEGNMVELGGLISTYAYSLSKCAEYFGQNHLTFWYTNDLATYQTRRFSWQAMQYAGWGSSNNSMTSTIAAICNCWTAENINPAIGPLFNTTDEGLKFIGGLDYWDSFYLMQWEFLQNKRTPFLNKDDAKVMLAMAPCEGPYCWSVGDNRAFGGWASTYRFERDFQSQTNGEGLGFEGVYNGLDYMLLYNLYYITELRDWKDGVRNGKLLPPYINIKNWTSDDIAYPYKNISNHLNPGMLTGNENIPYYAYGFSTIESSAIVDNVCHVIDQSINHNFSYTQTGTNCFGNVTYRAGEKITLKQGFTVKPGAYFRAFVEPFHCQCIDYTNTVNNFNYGIESQSDSSISLYYYSKYHDDFQPNKPEDIYIKDSVILTSDDNCKIFPNPFTDKFNVEYSVKGSSEIIISLISENGTKLKEIIRNQIGSGSYSETIDCSELAPGVYNCLIQTNNYTKSIKILKTR